MTNWLVPSNPKKFKLDEFLYKHEEVDWKQGTTKFKVGDIVYMYTTSPVQSIEYVFEVVGVNISFEDSIKDEIYWGDKNEFRVGIAQNRYCRLKLIERVSSSKLSLCKLKEHGLKGAPQGKMKIQSELFEYINSVLK